MFHKLGYRELHFYQQGIQALEPEYKPTWLEMYDWVIQNNQFIPQILFAVEVMLTRDGIITGMFLFRGL
jgi:hypothetical protein